jgi:orotidine-5'-phosphate decarboxylase
MKATSRVFCAVDTPSLDISRTLASALSGVVAGLKLGVEFFSANGPAGVQIISALGVNVFLDLKLHDIPNTVAGAVRSLVPLRPAFLTLHVSGGKAMLQAAVTEAAEAADFYGVPRPKLLGITVMTSLDCNDLRDIGQDSVPERQVNRLATLAEDSGLDGVVCSGLEITTLRRYCKPHFLLIVPGVRPVWAVLNDQKRVTSPGKAIALGADYLVVGRPITCAVDPAAVALRIATEICTNRDSAV